MTTSDYSASPYLSDVYKISGANTSKVTLACQARQLGHLRPGRGPLLHDLCGRAARYGRRWRRAHRQDRKPPEVDPKTAKVTKAGLTFKLTCVTDCTVSASGKLVYAKAKKKKKTKRASAAASTKLRTTKVKLKAGKSKTVVMKLSKGQRKAIKKAKKKKRKITANLKLKVTPKGAKATTRSLKLKVK